MMPESNPTGEEDPFSEYLAQEQTTGVPPAAAYQDAGAEADAGAQLRQLVLCAQRQEQLLGKICSVMVGLDEKMSRMAVAQERLEATMERFMEGGMAPAVGGSFVAPGVGAQRPSVTRGSLVQPPGKSAGGIPAAQAVPAGTSFTAAAEEQRLAAEKLAAERLRLEEESRRRAEELARKKEEEERRKREEAERLRLEEERRKEEERLRKEQLEKKTTGLMSNLISSSGGGGLFGDDDTGKKKSVKGGLFDD